jgi:sulfur carrier protein ThiS
MAGLVDIVREEVRKYAAGGRGLNLRLFFVGDELNHIYNVLDVEYPVRHDVAGIVVFARIVGDQVIIEEDTTDKPLVDALMQQGIPREQIVLAYQGEPVPDPIETL